MFWWKMRWLYKEFMPKQASKVLGAAVPKNCNIPKENEGWSKRLALWRKKLFRKPLSLEQMALITLLFYFSKWITAIAVAKLTFDGCSSGSIYKVIRSVLNFLFFFLD